MMVAQTASSRSNKRLKPGVKERAGSAAVLEKTKGTGLLTSIEQLPIAKIVIAICLVSFLAYANSLGGEFVFDDTEQIVENQSIRSWDNLGKAFATHVWAFRDNPGTMHVPPPLPYYRPLFTVMLTVEYHLFGLWPQGWHLVSLLLHVLCSVGVFYVLLLMSGRRLVALFASLLFAAHPIHAESVSWISGMTDPLFGVFFLGSFYFYLKARVPSQPGRARQRAFVLSLAMFVVSTFAKETALSLVLLVFGYEFIALTGSKADRLLKAAKRALPYAGVTLIYLVPRYFVLGELMWKNPQAAARPFTHTLLTLPFVVWSYISHLLWPIGLSVTYHTHFVTTAASGSFILPAAGLALIAAALFALRKRISREVWQALLLIAVPLLPVLNIGQVSREEYLIFDHYLYLSVAGLSWLIAMGIFKLGQLDRSSKSAPIGFRKPAIAIAVFAIITLALVGATARENRPWADSYSLWSNAVRVRPDYWAPHYNAGLALIEAKRFDEARDVLDRAVTLNPDESDVHDALGRALDATGNTAAATSSFQRAIDLDPEKFESLNNLGTIYFKGGNYAAAEKYFVAASAVKPRASVALFNLGLCYSRQGRPGDAVRQLERVRDLGSADDQTYYELGLAYEKTGRLADAIVALTRAVQITRSQDLAARASERLGRIQAEM